MKKRSIFIIFVTAIILLLNANNVFAQDPVYFASGHDPDSALWAPYIYTPSVTSITVSWDAQPGDHGVIRFEDKQRVDLPLSEFEMPDTTGSVTITPPEGAMYNALVLVTGSSYGPRFIWYSNVTYADGTSQDFSEPWQVQSGSD